jgi:hypothetical protein
MYTYYMRLKHMVKDKINFRARGPNQQLTRQPVQGRANDGGLRIGEMERDAVCAHGLAYFLNESFLIRGDEYYMAVCNKTGAISIYNDSRNLFLSPYADGPINFHTNTDGTMSIKNLTKYGRSFSLIRIPYSFKLLIQELQVMNVQMRIITNENVDQLMSMSYSNNISKLLQKPDVTSKEETEKMIKTFVKNMNLNVTYNIVEEPSTDTLVMPTPVDEMEIKNISDSTESPQYIPGYSPAYAPDLLETGTDDMNKSPINEQSSIRYEPATPSSSFNSEPLTETAPLQIETAATAPSQTAATAPSQTAATAPSQTAATAPSQTAPLSLVLPSSILDVPSDVPSEKTDDSSIPSTEEPKKIIELSTNNN